MKILKKIIQIFLLVTLTLATFSGCSCKEETEVYDGKFTFTIVHKEDTFYYPTIDGYVNSTKKPTAIYVTCNDKKTKLNVKSCVKKDGVYVTKFKQEIIYGKLEQGEHLATISCVFGKKEKDLKYTTNLYADELYTGMTGIADFPWDDPTAYPPRQIDAMDKESNWTKNY